MSLLPRTTEELMKIKELNVDVPKDLDFTLEMYSKDDREIGFVHNVAPWNPSALLNHKKRAALEKFLQLLVLRLTPTFIKFCLLLYNFDYIYPFVSSIVDIRQPLCNLSLHLFIFVYLRQILSTILIIYLFWSNKQPIRIYLVLKRYVHNP